MLHRLSLRVLPQLHALVTESSVRRRKRLVMIPPGLVAFLLYRLSQPVLDLSEPIVLLLFSGTLSALAAVWAYGKGREVSIATAFREDGSRRMAWLVVWIGGVYGVQLSLLVLALLKLFVAYDYLSHPDGPAMMALIIACTSVTRDAFEIGLVRRRQRLGHAITTFPDGGAWWQWVMVEPGLLAKWVGAAAGITGLGSMMVLLAFASDQGPLVHALLVSAMSACLALAGFYAAGTRTGDWWGRIQEIGWWPSLRFWIWPCLTFALTYYLVLFGVVVYVVRPDGDLGMWPVSLAGATAALMTAYGCYLGRRALLEEQLGQGGGEELQRCPFVMNILKTVGGRTTSGETGAWQAALGPSEHIGGKGP